MLKKRKVYIFLIFILSFLFYFIAGDLIHEMGFWSLREIYLAEKALLAVSGESSRFESIGLTYPTLPFIFLFLPVFLKVHLAAGILLSSLYGAATVLFFSSLVRDRAGLLALIFVFLQPLFLYSYSGGSDIGLFLLLIFLFIYFHKRFLKSEEKDVFSLFMSAIFLGISVLVRYEALLFIFPVVFTLIFDKNPWRLVSKPIVFIFPTLFIFGGLAYINWIYRGDPFYFTRSLPLQSELSGSGKVTLEHLFPPLLVFPSYIVSLWSVRKKIGLFILCLSPLIVALTAVWILGNGFPLSYYCLLAGTGLVFYEEGGVLIKRVFVSASIVGFLIAFVLPEKLMWGEEKKFALFLTHGDSKEMFKEEKEIANYLRQLDGGILFDDTYGYPVVFFHGSPKAFILPYNFEFGFYMTSPEKISKYVLVSDPEEERDLISQNNKNIFFEKNPAWELVEETGRRKLFKSKDPVLRRKDN